MYENYFVRQEENFIQHYFIHYCYLLVFCCYAASRIIKPVMIDILYSLFISVDWGSGVILPTSPDFFYGIVCAPCGMPFRCTA